MKIFFLGLNELGDACLTVLVEGGFTVACVVVPGRAQRTDGMRILCHERGIEHLVFTNMADLKQTVGRINPDLMVIGSFNRIIPKEIFDWPRLGTINVHPSKLPKLRGPYPVNWAIINDEKEIGATVHYLAEGADEGDILAQDAIPITDDDTFLTVRKSVHELGVRLLVEVVKRLERAGERIAGAKQDTSLATQAPKRTPEDSKIDWSKNSRHIFNLVRALIAPYQAFAYNTNGDKVEFIESKIKHDQGIAQPCEPGKVLGGADGWHIIATGDGTVQLKTDIKLTAGEVLM